MLSIYFDFTYPRDTTVAASIILYLVLVSGDSHLEVRNAAFNHHKINYTSIVIACDE